MADDKNKPEHKFFGLYVFVQTRDSSLDRGVLFQSGGYLGRAWELTGHREPGQNLHKAGKYMPISTLTRYKSKKSSRLKEPGNFF